MIAIIGRTSQIGKALNDELRKSFDVKVYGRNEVKYIHLDKPDIVINCAGPGSPNNIQDSGVAILGISDRYDNEIIEYIENNPGSKYVNISSGAVHGTDKIYYQTSKRVLEFKHRELSHLNIIDVRVYSFLSEFIDLNSDFFLAKIFNAMQMGNTFKVFKNEISRDYIGAEDLAQFIVNCPNENKVYEIYSKDPITNFIIIDYFKVRGLKAEVDDSVMVSRNDAYIPICEYYDWYTPKYDSMDLIKLISERIL